jgi:TolB-like protein
MGKEEARFFEFGGFRLDRSKRRLLCDGQIVPLTTKVFDTLLALVESNGEIIEKDDLIKKVWPSSFVEEGNLTQNISVLRKVLGERPGENQYIATVPRIGYRFVAEVTSLRDESRRREITRVEPTAAIAVLPFKLLASESRDEYLGLGLADALITRLSNVRQMIVRPTSAVLKYAQSNRDAIVIGQELNVTLVLEGSIRKSGERLRVTAQLVNVEDGRSLWANTFDEQFTDIFIVEDSIAGKVAAALALRLSSKEKETLIKRYTDHVEAYEAYLKGRYYSNKFTLENFHKAIKCFNHALEIDADYALAYAGMAESYWIATDLYLNPKEALQKTQDAAIKAVKADDNLAEAHTFLATTRMNYDWNWAEAEQHFKRAIYLNPGYATAHHWYGWYLTLMGHHDEAIAELERARQFDPFSIGINWFLSAALCLAGRYDESLEQAHNLIELEPNFWGGHWAKATAHTYKGEYASAIASYHKAGELDASPMIKGALAHVCGLSGRREEAEAILEEFKAEKTDQFVSPYYLALTHLALGEKGKAIEYLEKAYEVRDGSLPLIKVDYRFNDLRSDPAFNDLILRIGLTAANSR